MNNIVVNLNIPSLSQKEISAFLNKVNYLFIPSLSSRLDINEYSQQLSEKATHFTVYKGNKLLAFLACYFNNQQTKIGYITTLSTLAEYKGIGLGSQLIDEVIKYGKANNFKEIKLEVHKDNLVALNFYKRKGFFVVAQKLSNYLMRYSLIENESIC